MHLATAIDGPLILTRFEPVEEEEWAAADSATKEEKLAREGSGFWVVFFTIHKDTVSRFVDELEAALEGVGEAFSVASVDGSRYVYVLASTTTYDLVNCEDGTDQKAWMTCMRVSRAYAAAGCTLFAPKSFLEFDRIWAEKLLTDCLDLDVSQIK